MVMFLAEAYTWIQLKLLNVSKMAMMIKGRSDCFLPPFSISRRRGLSGRVQVEDLRKHGRVSLYSDPDESRPGYIVPIAGSMIVPGSARK